MSTDKQEAILRKVRGLIAKANSTPFEGEADVFRAKADELMAVYHIEAWRVAQSEPEKSNLRPERRDMDFAWYSDRSTSEEVREQSWSLFLRLVSHCNCVVATRHVNWYENTIPVYGLPADLDFLSMLFTSLMIQMGRRLKPDYDPKASLGHNIYTARQAGMKYADIALWMGKPEWVVNGRPVDHGIMAREYKIYIRDNELEDQPVTQIKTYLRSYMSGFVSGVTTLLRNQREEQTQSDTTGSLLPALRDARQMAQSMMDEELGRAHSTSRAVSRSSRKIDYAAHGRGVTHGKQADIGRKNLGNRRELGS